MRGKGSEKRRLGKAKAAGSKASAAENPARGSKTPSGTMLQPALSRMWRTGRFLPRWERTLRPETGFKPYHSRTGRILPPSRPNGLKIGPARDSKPMLLDRPVFPEQKPP